MHRRRYACVSGLRRAAKLGIVNLCSDFVVIMAIFVAWRCAVCLFRALIVFARVFSATQMTDWRKFLGGWTGKIRDILGINSDRINAVSAIMAGNALMARALT